MTPTEPQSISTRAAEDLSFIRAAMERSSTFTAIPGMGGVAMGTIALTAAAFGPAEPSGDRWLATWLAAAATASAVGLVTMARKARVAGLALGGATARRFALGMAAPLVAGAAITYAMWRDGHYAVMAPAWLLLYGTGVVIGGLFSVPLVRVIGVCFMAAGLAAVVTPPEWANGWMAIGFGGFHIGFGMHIARHHGG